MANNLIYFFGKSRQMAMSMKALLGGKGANLAQMTKIGLPVPSGFTITTEVAFITTRTARNHQQSLVAGNGKGRQMMMKRKPARSSRSKRITLVPSRSGARG